jgi:UDP-N-acetylmuramate: L-alanyl-gamma-D-glutamyl-meso-diaminopimelate ligase
MHVHILGIGGTFMGGIALIAREAGHTVTGSDSGLYPPMSTMLAEQGIRVHEGYDIEPLKAEPDMVVVGNALSRGNPCVEYMLDMGLPYSSGPQWLAENILRDRWVLAVSGTHGKTTTTSLLTWILESAGLNPGFLVGGVPGNFGRSARLGRSPFFVIEADEYDSAFFDKRSKFVHFRPRTLIINNIEYDHADIFPDLAAIQRQFHHLVRTVPGSGLILANGDQGAVEQTLAQGCWTPVERFGTGTGNDWRLTVGGEGFRLEGPGTAATPLRPPLPGAHNARNTVAALLAARHAGVALEHGVTALREFRGVRRRLEVRGEAAGVTVIDDFAHHPSAIAATLEAVREQRSGRVLAVVEPRSNTMKLGVHQRELADSLSGADRVFAFRPPDLSWDLGSALSKLADAVVEDEIEPLVAAIVAAAAPGDTVLVMSNGAFGGIHERLLSALAAGEQNQEGKPC